MPDATLVDLFEAQVARTPDAVAVVFEGEALSYAEFASRGAAYCAVADCGGCGAGLVGGLGMRRSVDLLVGMYAVLAAGGAYVPIDPDQPTERNRYILATANPVCCLPPRVTRVTCRPA
ncbi:AMP-binding protein [Rhodococcus hoagii]|nr:AMP-binding protein [Prescottella equi]